MNPGDIIFVSGTDWISSVIRWVTRSRYSHVAIYVGEDSVIEAQPFRKVGLESIAAYSGLYEVVQLPTIIDEINRQKGLYWLYAQRGRHYSYWSDFVILIRNLFGLVIPWHEGDDIICSRLARDFLAECGLPIPDEDMSPEDVYEWLEQMLCIRKEVPHGPNGIQRC